jgi:hypothetical protein
MRSINNIHVTSEEISFKELRSARDTKRKKKIPSLSKSGFSLLRDVFANFAKVSSLAFFLSNSLQTELIETILQ